MFVKNTLARFNQIENLCSHGTLVIMGLIIFYKQENLDLATPQKHVGMHAMCLIDSLNIT